jgi:imidazolonepropionase-like amidohydrolase
MAKATRLLIKNGTLIDGLGGDPVPNRLLVVEGNRITLVGEPDGSMWPETPDDRVIDAVGKFILPGLIDAHCHISLHQGALPGLKYTSTAEFCTLWAAHAIGRVLRAGVTSIAVPGGKWFTDVTVREAVEGGLLEGPRMVVAGRALSNYGGIFDPDPYPAFEGTPADTYGNSAAWYRGTQLRCEGRIKAGGIEKDVAFADADPSLNDRIDAAYRAKYRRHGARWVDPMVAPEARATTIRLVPR